MTMNSKLQCRVTGQTLVRLGLSLTVSTMCFFSNGWCGEKEGLWAAAELAELQRADGKVHMQLIPHKGVSEQLDLQMCKRPDGTDWLLGVGGYAKVHTAECLSHNSAAIATSIYRVRLGQ